MWNSRVYLGFGKTLGTRNLFYIFVQQEEKNIFLNVMQSIGVIGK